MWCFLDESYPPEGGVTAIAGCLMQTRAVQRLDRELFVARRTHFGDEHARDLHRELKGKDLLSRQSFIRLARHGEQKNHAVASDVLDACVRIRGTHPIYVFGAVVYGAHDLLTTVTEKKLMKPLTHILNLVSSSAGMINPRDRVNLVFDEQLGTRADVAIRARQFIAGVELPNVSPYPLSAVSNVSPGIQLADLCAFILGRQAIGDRNFLPWMSKLRRLEWRGHVHRRGQHGLAIFQRNGDGQIVRISGWKSLKK